MSPITLKMSLISLSYCFDQICSATKTIGMNPMFKARYFEVKNLKITFSEGGDVAWFYCLLDDFGKWDDALSYFVEDNQSIYAFLPFYS